MAGTDWIDRELAKRGVKAERAGAAAAAAEPRAKTARYDARHDRVVVEMTNGCVFAFPPRLAEGLRNATPAQLRGVEVTPRGGGLHWETLDVDLSVPRLVLGVFGSRAWMSELGRRGGSASSRAKALSARRNGKLGGRPPADRRRTA